MGPQNSDPNSPSQTPTQPDLSSVLGATPSPGPTPPSPPPPPTEPPSVPEPSPIPPDPMPTAPEPTPPPLSPPSEPPNPISSPPTDSPPPPEPPPVLEPTPETPPLETPPLSEPNQGNPLDNPMGVPAEEPQLDGGGLNAGFNWSTNPEPTEPTASSYPQPPLTQTSPPPSPFDTPPNGLDQPPPPITADTPPNPVEPAPTDLSQLANTPDQNVYTPPMSQPETLVVPPATPETIQAESSEGHGLPKWVWVAGAAVLLVVIAATAYFILGIGRQTPSPQSAPAAEQQSIFVAPPVPTPVVESPTPAATSSAGFSSVGGSTQTQTATSAADILKQKLQK